jgi:pimeloyl-ACP methyl ester carboxylesterase
MKSIARLAVAMMAALCFMAAALPAYGKDPQRRVENIVLVHGAWADGSSWEGVYQYLTRRGFHVSIVQNPLTSLADDVAATERVLARQDGPAILVGHSYGGAVITAAGANPKVVGLVYIAAFAPDAGESLLNILQTMSPPNTPPLPITPSADGYLFFNPDQFHAQFAADLSRARADFLAAGQVPFAAAAFATPMGAPAWKSKPSWYMVATEDHAIPPDVQRRMSARMGATVVERRGSHLVYVSRPRDVADLVEQAARSERVFAPH